MVEQATNYPLGSVVFFNPLLMALTHLVRTSLQLGYQRILILQRLNSGPKRIRLPSTFRCLPVESISADSRSLHSVSLFGLIQMRAPYFPFALIGIELVRGGPIAALRSFTGLASAHLYYFLTTVGHLSSRSIKSQC